MIKMSNLLSAFNTLQQALSIVTNNWKPLLPIMLINLLFSSLIFLSNFLSITPTLTEFKATIASFLIMDPQSSEYSGILSTMRKDVREITTIEAVFFVSFFIVSSFVTMTTIHIISMACTEKKQTPQELFSVIRRTWKGPLLTQLFTTILNISVSFFLFILIIAFIMISIGSFGYTTAGAFLAILAILLHLYVLLICSMSVVVSVVEEGCYGVAAFERSVELTKGRRQIGMMTMFITSMGGGIITVAYNFSVLYPSANNFVRLVVGFGYAVTFVMMTVLIHAVNTVFYYECKSYGSQLLAMEGGLGYTSMLTEPYASNP